MDAVFAGFLQGVSLARLSQRFTRQETSEILCDAIAVTLPIQHLARGNKYKRTIGAIVCLYAMRALLEYVVPSPPPKRPVAVPAVLLQDVSLAP